MHKYNNYILDHKKHSIGNSQIYYYKINSENLKRSHVTHLSLAAQNKAHKYISKTHKNRHIIRHLLLKEMLRSYGEIFYYDHHGKLCLEESDIGFSISYSNDNFITAISTEKMVGIDIEEIKPLNNYQTMLHLFLTTDEINIINQYPDNQRLTLIYSFWTAKEAFIKAIGLGMKFDLKNIEFNLDPNKQLFVKTVNHNSLSTNQIILNQLVIDNLSISVVEVIS